MNGSTMIAAYTHEIPEAGKPHILVAEYEEFRGRETLYIYAQTDMSEEECAAIAEKDGLDSHFMLVELTIKGV